MERDDAMDRVLANERKDWSLQVFEYVKKLPKGWVGLGEDIRFGATLHGIRQPHHPNCWGAIINALTRAGMLTRTGNMAKPTARASHARKSQEYTR